MSADTKPRLVGVNHVALKVGDVEAALQFCGKIFAFELRGRGQGQAFLDMGDQFLALMKGRRQAPDDHRHFGLVIDDRSPRPMAHDLVAAGHEPAQALGSGSGHRYLRQEVGGPKRRLSAGGDRVGDPHVGDRLHLPPAGAQGRRPLRGSIERRGAR